MQAWSKVLPVESFTLSRVETLVDSFVFIMVSPLTVRGINDDSHEASQFPQCDGQHF